MGTVPTTLREPESLDLRVMRRLPLMTSQQKEELIENLDKFLPFPGRLKIYPDIWVTDGDRKLVYSFDPLKEEYFLVSSTEPDEWIPISINLEVCFELERTCLRWKNKRREEVENYRQLGYGELYVKFRNGIHEILNSSLHTVAKIEDQNQESKIGKNHFTSCEKYFAIRSPEDNHLDIYSRETYKKIAYIRYVEAQGFIDGIKCSSERKECLFRGRERTSEDVKCEEHSKVVHRCGKPLLVVTSTFNRCQIEIRDVETETTVSVGGEIGSSWTINHIGGYIFAASSLEEKTCFITEYEVPKCFFDPESPQREKEKMFQSSAPFLVRLGDDMFMDIHHKILKLNPRGTEFEHVDTLPEGRIDLLYPSRSRLKEIARMFEEEAGTTLEVLAIVMGFCCERIP